MFRRKKIKHISYVINIFPASCSTFQIKKIKEKSINENLNHFFFVISSLQPSEKYLLTLIFVSSYLHQS